MKIPLSLLIKPVSGACNMRCSYCFYADIADKRSRKNLGLMTDETAELLVRRALEGGRPGVTFIFQGGEPTLWSLDKYRRFIEAVKGSGARNTKIDYAIQTNGLIIDDEWARFFRENKFLVGLSIDGPQDIHDVNRKDAAGEGTFSRVMNAARILKKHGVDFNILTVVHDGMTDNGVNIYRYYKAHGFRYLQFIPCIDDFGAERTRLSPKRYGRFLKSLFEAWHNDYKSGDYVSIRHIDNLIGILQGRPPENCAQEGRCGVYFVVEADGSLYPCDFYCLDKWRLGSLADENCFEVNGKHKEFLAGADRPPARCAVCKYFALCRGGCRRDREPDLKISKYCKAYGKYYDAVSAIAGIR